MAKKKLTKEEKKMKHAQAVSGNGTRGPSPYYPTDYSIGKRNPKKEEKPMKEQKYLFPERRLIMQVRSGIR